MLQPGSLSDAQFLLVQMDPASTQTSANFSLPSPVMPSSPLTITCDATADFQHAIPTTTGLEPFLHTDALKAIRPTQPILAPPTASVPLLTPPLGEDMESAKPDSSPARAASLFPVKVTLLPNRGRSYIATRLIEKDELVLVAESYGTTMCDTWQDCGVCHFCWQPVPDRKTQIRLPQQKPQQPTFLQGKTSNKKQSKRLPTVMVFCDQKCLDDYGPSVAEAVCRIEQHVRRPWITTQVMLFSKSERDVDVPECQKRIDRAYSLASTRSQVAQLSDQDFGDFLTIVWSAIDSWVTDQLVVMEGDQSGTISGKKKNMTLSGTDGHLARFPAIAQYLLSKVQPNLETRATDDDCEKLRLMAEVLCRRQIQDASPPSTTTQATFADYCAMQSNEVVVLREALTSEIQEQRQHPNQEGSEGGEKALPALVALLPSSFHEALYAYLRLRDALYIINCEMTVECDHNGCRLKDASLMTGLQVDHSAFRSMLYKEVANSFGIRDGSDELLGFAVFPRACFFNHSCDPNIQKRRAVRGLPCIIDVEGTTTSIVRRRTMEFYAARRIEKGEECCISYGDISAGRAERRARLQEMYFFPCSCARCEREA